MTYFAVGTVAADYVTSKDIDRHIDDHVLSFARSKVQKFTLI